MDSSKAIRLALMVAKGVGSAMEKPLFKAGGGKVIPHGHPERQQNLAKFMEGAHPSVLNEDGTPKRFYHATQENFSKFRPSHRNAYFFTPDPEFANEYLGIDDKPDSELHGSTIMPVHLDVKNPFDYENPTHIENLKKKIPHFFKKLDDADLQNLEEGSWHMLEMRDVQNAIRNLGHDSFHVAEGDSKNIGVFQPNQIKSAIGNRGTFDPNEPEIHKADGGDVEGEPTEAPQRQLTQQGLYSAAANAARSLKQEAGSPARMLNLLRGSSGVKKEEIQNANPESAFAGRDRITREELAKHFEDSLPKVKEETRSRWKQYSTPGSEDYRERILSLPNNKGSYENTTHWPGIINPLVHVRMGDRTEPSASPKARGPLPPKADRTVSVSKTRYGETEATMDDVPGWSTPTPGLVINKSDDRDHPWTLTHEKSGFRITNGHTYWGLHKMAKQLAGHMDWTAPKESITGYYNDPSNADHKNELHSLMRAAKTPPTGEPDDFHKPEPWQLAGRKTRKPSTKTVVEGPKKHLLVDELQSDWGQSGRSSGFGEGLNDEDYRRLFFEARKRLNKAIEPLGAAQREETAKIVAKRDAEWDRLSKEYQSKIDDIYGAHLDSDDPDKFSKIHEKKKLASSEHMAGLDQVNKSHMENVRALRDKFEQASREHNERYMREVEDLDKRRSQIPSAPWVTDTKGWADLGLKRALWEAANGGHDTLVWTPGSVQARRYPEPRHVADMLSYHPEKKEFTAWKDGRSVHSEDNASPQRLATLIGKGPAEQLLASERGTSGHHNLKTSDISIAPREAGMTSFYEGLIPERLKSILKVHGITPEIGKLNSKDKKIHGWPSMRITPEMRASILKNGFPAFKSGGDVEKASKLMDHGKAIRRAMMIAKNTGAK